MKVSLVLIFILAQVSASTYSQTAKLTLNLEKVTLSEFFDKIEETSEFKFFYDNDEIDPLAEISVDVDKSTIENILVDIFTDTDVSYEIFDRYIILKKNKLAEPTKISFTKQQDITIKGKVADKDNNPLPGVNVIEKGTTNGTVTNLDGEYSIIISSSDAVLSFSYVGFLTEDVSVNGRSSIEITLIEDIQSLEEVVVVGYGTVSKKNLTTAISKVVADDVSKSSNSNMSQLLMGRAAGLQATVASAQPGGNVDISIRGADDPIYVVDGIVMPTGSLESGSGGSTTVIPSSVDRSGLAGLNPEDIESIEILKDASASIYGIGAANGVILITTKKGKDGPLRVSYNGSYSMVENYDYVQPLNSQEYMGLVNTFSKEQYLYNNEMVAYGANAYDNGWTPIFSESQIANAPNYNWLEQVLKSGSVSNHNLIINGGSEKVSYYMSGNYFKQIGTVTNSSMERYSLRSNVSYKLASFLKLSSIININRNSYDNSSVGGSSSGRGSQAAGALTAALSYPSYLPFKDENGEYSQFGYIPNAVAMQQISDDTYANGAYLNFMADITLVKDMLNAKLVYGNNNENTNRSVFIPSDVYFDQTYDARGNLAEDRRTNQTMEATLVFNKKFGDILNMDAIIGIGKYLNSTCGFNVAYDGQHDAIANNNLSSVTDNINPGSYKTEDEKRSQFVRANFDILDRYVIASTLRRDGTDKFFPDKKYALFPSVSFAWKITNESFLQNVDWLNLLKLRASYGTTGNDNLGTTLYGTYSPSGIQIKFDEGSDVYATYIQKGIDYPNVTWEKTVMKNIGVDFYIFNNRISGSFDLFRNDITDMLGSANSAGLSMFGTYPINGGHIRREGWDATFNSKNVQVSDFTWSSSLTLSKYNSIWIERFPNYDYELYQVRDNEPTSARYYYETSGIINAELSNIPASQPEEYSVAGFPIIKDQNGDDEITVDDVVMSNEVPKIYFGFGNTFTYKNFDLDIFMYSQIGVNKYNYAWDWANGSYLANQTNNSNKYTFDVWNSETNPNGKFPGLAYELSDVALPGDAGVDLKYQDASFLRFRNITLGYNISGNKLGALGNLIDNMRIYVDAQNPITLTNFEGYDPEVRTGGSYKTFKAEYPQTRTFSVGAKFNFK